MTRVILMVLSFNLYDGRALRIDSGYRNIYDCVRAKQLVIAYMTTEMENYPSFSRAHLSAHCILRRD